jgi:hypothetical protein
MDWPYPCGGRRPFSYLVDATAFRSLTLGLPSSQNRALRGHPPPELQQTSIFCKDVINDESHDGPMKRIVFLLVVVGTLAGVVASSAPASGYADETPASIFGGAPPPGYRDWKLISVAHEEGNLNDLRAILGNDIAIKAYREDKLPFPDGTIIARLAWSYESSEENNKAFGRSQSFVAGHPRTGFNLWSRTQKNMSRREAGDLLNSSTVNLPGRRC